MVEQVGRAEAPGRPITYGTTGQFLEYFGLRNLGDLPAADELRRVAFRRPESLLTADPGLATVPPEQLALAENAPAADPHRVSAGKPATTSETATDAPRVTADPESAGPQ